MTAHHHQPGAHGQKQSAWEEFAGLTKADLRQISWRGPMRLAGLMAVTSGRIAQVGLAAATNRWQPEYATRKAQAWARNVLVVCGIEATHKGDLPPGPMLLVANHRSYIDIAPILARVPCSFVAKSELRSWPILGKGAALGNTVFVERADASSRQRTRHAIVEALEQGLNVVVFPEGTTSGEPGLLPFRPGLFRAVAGHNFPVVPVAITYQEGDIAYVGEDTFLGNFMRVFSRPRIRLTVNYGPALIMADPDQLRQSAWQWVSDRVTDS
jgi:1-acyl-sn-glycerol-3-phosphate acyltransferase